MKINSPLWSPVSSNDKAGLVAHFLAFRFPMCGIELTDEAGKDPEFRVDRGGRTDRLVIDREFMNGCAGNSLMTSLVQLDIYDLFSQAKGRKVFILNRGTRFE
jgi:hypothetical protein